jgi:hypothetical protein
VNSKKLVSHLNAQYVGGKSAAQLAGATKAVVVDMASGVGTAVCPAGTHPVGGGVLPDPTGADDAPVIVVSSPNVTSAGKFNGWLGVAADGDKTYNGEGFVFVSCTTGTYVVSGRAAATAVAREDAEIRLAQQRIR